MNTFEKRCGYDLAILVIVSSVLNEFVTTKSWGTYVCALWQGCKAQA